MIAADATLTAFMESARSAHRFDLYTITTAAGQVLSYTNSDRPITTGDSRTFVCGPLLTRNRLKVSRGIEVDTLNVSITPRNVDLLGGRALLQAARAGALRGCRVLLEWAYLDVDRVFKGVMPRFVGSGSPTAFEAGVIELAVRSELERLVQSMPRDVYQPRCLNQVFDAGCGLDIATSVVTGAVTGTPASRSEFGSGLAQGANFFNQGVVMFTSGANAGVRRTVRSFAPVVAGAFTVALPFPADIAAGDAFSATPGCDGTMAVCSNRFANLPRFRGQPFIPAPETAT